MTKLTQIERRHRRDRWKDLVFIAAAVLLAAASIGAVTTKAAGKPPTPPQWTLTVVENPELAE